MSVATLESISIMAQELSWQAEYSDDISQYSVTTDGSSSLAMGAMSVNIGRHRAKIRGKNCICTEREKPSTYHYSLYNIAK